MSVIHPMNIALSKPHFVHILLVLMTMLAATFKTKKRNKKNITFFYNCLNVKTSINQIDGREKNPRNGKERGNENMNWKFKSRDR